ncbi:MAG: LysM peptidoglycan-binding domain-containing protein [Oscillospiraceae bacterium]|nr:LysM peptidoglycan-binding domain-containing protein [Oscillospiraceae bacterium]
MEIYVVSQGDTLLSIAESFGVSAERLSQTNEIPPETPLVPGQTVVVLFPRTVHTVQEGERLSTIASRYGVTENELFRNNINLGGQEAIYPGQSIVIDYLDAPTARATFYGYAYPFINIPLLRQTLPYNDYLAPFTYGITPSGELVELDDGELLTIAREYGKGALMHLSTLTEEGNFDSALGAYVLNTPSVRESLIENVVTTVRERGYSGLDVDFEYLPESSAAPYADFIGELTRRLNAEGKPVIVALAPKTSATQPGLLYEGHSYELLGEAANFVLLMTYEWGYSYGPPLAVAPIPNVRRVLDYAVSVIPREKIFLGIPNYGYDWTLPFVQGESRAESISNVRAVEIAREAGVAIAYDETSQSPNFNYTAPDGRKHEVWFEDARSIDAKLALVREYGLFGAGYWNLMRPFPQNWLVLNARFDLVT